MSQNDKDFIATGGKNVYGASVGILMLDSQFPRIVGDVGNAQTWDFPVLYRTVSNASIHQVVHQRADGLLDAFVEAGEALIAQGADGITTSCGFLALHQDELAERLPVPVATSSLLQIPLINLMLGRKRCGIITVNAESLSHEHLRAVNVPLDTPIIGMEGRNFAKRILNNADSLNVSQARRDMVEVATLLMKQHDNIGAIVLECTNMAPYARDIQVATGVPVYSIVTLIEWFQAGLSPRQFS